MDIATHDDIRLGDGLQEPLLPAPNEQIGDDDRQEEQDYVNNNDRNDNHDNQQPGEEQDNVHISRNIPLTLWYNLFRCSGEAIWYYSVLSAYVYLLQPRHAGLVGYLSALEGVVQFLAALVAGVVADRYRRDRFLQGSCVIGVLASLLTFTSTLPQYYHDNDTDHDDADHTVSTVVAHLSPNNISLVCLLAAMLLWGTFDGIALTASMALFADSIRDGDRSYYFTKRTISFTLGNVLGPIAGIILFYVLGDQWTVLDCAKVIGWAQLVLVPAFIILCFFRDDDTPLATTTLTSTEQEQQQEQQQRQDDPEQPCRHLETEDPMVSSTISEHQESNSNYDPIVAVTMEQVTHTQQEEQQEQDDDVTMTMLSSLGDFCCCRRLSKPRVIAVTAAGSDIACAISMGISFRYFAIFFLHDLHLGPVFVQVMDAISCLMGIVLLQAAQRLSLVFGRCPIAVALKCLGAAALMIMALAYTWAWPKTIVVALYLLQGSLLNSTGALTRSLVMDNVPSEERAKWSALESINIFGWCGSAALGGYLVYLWDGAVVPLFYLTASLQIIGALPLVMLFGIENREQPSSSSLYE